MLDQRPDSRRHEAHEQEVVDKQYELQRDRVQDQLVYFDPASGVGVCLTRRAAKKATRDAAQKNV